MPHIVLAPSNTTLLSCATAMLFSNCAPSGVDGYARLRTDADGALRLDTLHVATPHDVGLRLGLGFLGGVDMALLQGSTLTFGNGSAPAIAPDGAVAFGDLGPPGPEEEAKLG